MIHFDKKHIQNEWILHFCLGYLLMSVICFADLVEKASPLKINNKKKVLLMLKIQKCTECDQMQLALCIIAI